MTNACRQLQGLLIASVTLVSCRPSPDARRKLQDSCRHRAKVPQVAIKQSQPLQMRCNGAALPGVALLLLVHRDHVVHAQQRAVDDEGPEAMAPALSLLLSCRIWPTNFSL